MLGNANAEQRYDSQNSRFWVKDMRRTRTRTRVILASRAAPPHAAGSQKSKYIYIGHEYDAR